MRRSSTIETSRDRVALARDAGLGRISGVSILSGVLVAYGAFAVLFLCWLFGGYVAGRMARRSGVANGIATFVLGIVVIAVVAVIARASSDASTIRENLRSVGLPTTGSEWKDIFSVAGIASLAAMVVGSVLGGSLGERWHAKLLARAVDPDVGAEAQLRRDAEERQATATGRHSESVDRVERTRAGRPVVTGDDTDRVVSRDDDVVVRRDLRDDNDTGAVVASDDEVASTYLDNIPASGDITTNRPRSRRR
jgi:hypothetical protein